MYFVYILKCADKTLYIGYAKDVQARVQTHNEGKRGAKYTRARRPVVLVYKKGFRTLSKALKREHEMKSWTRAEKLAFLKRT
jgi:putative endonuclease